MPETAGLTFAHSDVAGPSFPLYFKSMLLNFTFWQGRLLLHESLTATLVVDVPRMLLKLTSLILTREGT